MALTREPHRRLTTGDVDDAAAVLVRALFDDPVWRFVLPSPRRRARTMNSLVRADVERYVADADAFRNEHGVALWRRVVPRPESARSPRPSEVLDRRPSREERDQFGRHWRRARRVAGAIRALRPDPGEHHYLHLIGVDPGDAGQGHGAALVTPVLDELDGDGVPAFLVSSNPDNLGFYRRFGFVVSGSVELPGGPMLHAMWRGPRGGSGQGTPGVDPR